MVSVGDLLFDKLIDRRRVGEHTVVTTSRNTCKHHTIIYSAIIVAAANNNNNSSGVGSAALATKNTLPRLFEGEEAKSSNQSSALYPSPFRAQKKNERIETLTRFFFYSKR